VEQSGRKMGRLQRFLTRIREGGVKGALPLWPTGKTEEDEDWADRGSSS